MPLLSILHIYSRFSIICDITPCLNTSNCCRRRRLRPFLHILQAYQRQKEIAVVPFTEDPGARSPFRTEGSFEVGNAGEHPQH